MHRIKYTTQIRSCVYKMILMRTNPTKREAGKHNYNNNIKRVLIPKTIRSFLSVRINHTIRSVVHPPSFESKTRHSARKIILDNHRKIKGNRRSIGKTIM